MSADNRYKRWRLFNRKPDIVVPQIVRYINLIDAYEAARSFRLTEQNPYTLTAISCSFAPDDARTLGTVGTFPYYILNTERFTVPCGYVSVWDTYEEECEHNGILFSYAVQPSPTFSQCGNIYCAVMNSSYKQLSLIGYDSEEDDKYFDSIPLSFGGGNLCGKTLCACVNEDYAVTITNMKMQNDLDICNFSVWKVKPDLKLRHRGTKYIEDIVGYSGLGIFLLDAGFAPNPKYFGILMSNNYFFLVNIHTRVCESVKKLGAMLNCPVKSFCFDPKFSHAIIAVASLHEVYIVNVVKEGGEAVVVEIPLQDQSSGVKHVAFSKDGQLLGVATGNGNTLVYSSYNRYVLSHVLCPANCQDTFPELFGLENISANRISFSSSAEELSVAYSNGYVCIWQLPRKLKLKDICRLKVLCLYPLDFIETLDIPKKLKRYIKFEPVFI